MLFREAMTNAYTKDQLVEQPAIGQFSEHESQP